MDWLNYHHLLYFHTVAKEGSVARASQVLRLAQQTLSGQIRKLEHVRDEKLFERRGRNVVLTEMGRVAYRYAEETFSLGGELMEAMRGRPTNRAPRLIVGIADSIPKLVAHRLLATSRLIEEGVQLVLREGKTNELLAGLGAQAFDLVITDTPLSSQVKVRAFNHLLGESAVTIFAAPELAKRHRARFPKSLDGAPFMLPTENSALRRPLEQWFEEIGVRPRVVAEIEDSALLKVFGQHGAGLFAAPSIVAADVKRQYGVMNSEGRLTKLPLSAWGTKGFEFWTFLSVLLKAVRPQAILELGCGRSSTYFADYAYAHGATYVGVENDLRWFNKTELDIALLGFGKRHLAHVALAADGSWYNLEAFKAATGNPGHFDFAFIDGPNEKRFLSSGPRSPSASGPRMATLWPPL